jgi:hypothetical protein
MFVYRDPCGKYKKLRESGCYKIQDAGHKIHRIRPDPAWWNSMLASSWWSSTPDVGLVVVELDAGGLWVEHEAGRVELEAAGGRSSRPVSGWRATAAGWSRWNGSAMVFFFFERSSKCWLFID